MIYLIALLASTLIVWLCTQLGLCSWRKAARAHWTEQARLLFPIRVSRQIFVWTIPLISSLIAESYDSQVSGVTVGACSFVGALLGNYPMDRVTNPGLGFGTWAHQVFVTSILQLTNWAAYLVTALLMPHEWSYRSWLVAGGCLCFQGIWQFGLAQRLMRIFGLLEAAPTGLQSMVLEVSTAMRVPVRSTWYLASVNANALAFVMTGELAFTRKLCAVCNEVELKAICAHELGHLQENRWTRLGRFVGALLFFPLIFIKPAQASHEFLGYALMAFSMGVIWIGQQKLSQRMEKRADQIACSNVANPEVYARALEKLHQANLMPVILQKKMARSHPDLYDRMVSAGVTPEYPRPPAPAEQHWTSVVTTIVATLLVLFHCIPSL